LILVQNKLGKYSVPLIWIANPFWESANDLENIEFVEIDGDLIRITEQNLQTYAFYKAFLLEKKLSLTSLLHEFFPEYSNQIKEAVIGANNTFDYDNIKEKIVTSLLGKLKTIQDEKEKILFFECFWFYCQNQVFQFVDNHIKQLSVQDRETHSKIDSIYQTSKHFRLVINFLHYNNKDFLPALQLLIEFVKKSPNHFAQLAEILNGRLIYSDDTYPNYEKQGKYLNLIVKNWNRDPLYKRLFLSTANQFLYSTFTTNGPMRRRNSISLAQHSAPLNATLRRHRKLIWDQILKKFDGDANSFTNIITHYADHRIDLIKNFIQYDSSYLSKIILNKYDASNLVQIISAARVENLILKLKIKSDLAQKIRSRYLNSKTFKMYSILSWASDPERINYKGDIEKYTRYKANLVIKNFGELSMEELSDLVEFVNTWHPLIGDHYSHGLFYSLDILSKHYLTNDQVNKTATILEGIIKTANPANFVPYQTIPLFAQKGDLHDTYLSFIENHTFKSIVDWIGVFIQNIKSDKIASNYRTTLTDTIKDQSEGFYFDFTWIGSFGSTVQSEILSLLLEKWRKSKCRIILPREFFIKSAATDIPLDLLKKAYIMQYLIVDTFDFRGEGFNTLITKDDTFLMEFCREVFGRKNFHGSKDSSFIKGLVGHPNLEALTSQFLNFLSKREHIYPDDFYTTLNETFSESNVDFKKYIISYLSKNAKILSKAKLAMDLVCEVWKGEVIFFMKIFLKYNSKLEDFKRINWGATGGFFSGRINISETYLGKWKAIQEGLGEFESLKYLEHKIFVDDMVHHSEKRTLEEARELFLKRSFFDD
jgi:hypothetical protein